MYAVVEFMSSEEEVSSYELAIVPLLWLHKQEKKCYWPITTKKIPFSEFVKNQTPVKKTWPSYTVFKIHFKTEQYEKAEEKLEILLEGFQNDQGSLSASSCASFVKKTLDDSDDDSDTSVSMPETFSSQKNKATVSVTDVDLQRLTTTVKNVSNINASISNSQGTNMSHSGLNMSAKKCTASRSTVSDIPSSADSDPETSFPSVKRILLSPSTSRNSSLIGSTDTASTVSVSPELLTPTNSSEIISDVSHNYLQEVLNMTTKIQTEIENHSVILHELLRQNRKINTDKLIAPSNLPTFPIGEHGIFLDFNQLLSTDSTVYDYMVKRLAAVGGGSIQSHTRRILKHIMSDHIAVLYNWKGRDKLSFQKTSAMTLIYEAAKLNYPNEERNDLLIENAVKDYLKFAKSRLNLKKK